MKEIPNPYRGKAKGGGINLSPLVIDYFKEMSSEIEITYQKLIDMYLVDCVKNKRKIDFKWNKGK